MNTITKKVAAAVIGLVSLALPAAPALATDMGVDYYDTGWSDTGYYDMYDASYDTYNTAWTDTGYYDIYDASYDTYNTAWTDTGYYDMYDASYDSYGGYSTPSYSSPSFSYPSFGGSSYSQPIYTSAANQQYRNYVAPQLPTFVQPNVANTCTAVNSCNTDNSYTDNSVYAPDNSYTYTNTVTDNSVYSAPTTVTAPTTISYGPITTSHDSHNQQISYPQPQYQAPVFQQPQYQQQYQYQAQYQQPVYQPQRPVSYNTTPYITLSQAPYTGLDLGPVGEAMYWAFLVLWCLGAAYLIVVKRVQNKLVASLNHFLFGSSAKAAAHTAHAPQAHASVSATLVEEGIDPFIQSQIKRA